MSFLEDEACRLQESDGSPKRKTNPRARESLGGTSARSKEKKRLFLGKAHRFPSLDMADNSLTSSPCKSARERIIAVEPSISMKSSSVMQLGSSPEKSRMTLNEEEEEQQSASSPITKSPPKKLDD